MCDHLFALLSLSCCSCCLPQDLAHRLEAGAAGLDARLRAGSKALRKEQEATLATLQQDLDGERAEIQVWLRGGMVGAWTRIMHREGLKVRY